MSWVQHVKNLIENEWDQKYIVIGIDCDSMLCASILKLRYPNAKIIGLYETEYLVQVQPGTKAEFKDQFKKALWLDQDILYGFLCIGQHMVTGDCLENIPKRNQKSFNPNEFYKQEYQHSFRTEFNMSLLKESTDCEKSCIKAKCPFSTAMLLLHIYDDLWTRNPMLDTLIMHADSFGYNLTIYPTNCEAWRRLLFNSGSQINDIICEMQKVYNHRWRPICSEDHNCCEMNNCYCEECAKICLARKKQRILLERHFRFMETLQNLMPNYFDKESRKNNKGNNDEIIKNEAVTKKRPHWCTGEYVHDLSKKLGGYQGLKLRFQSDSKLSANFDKMQFLGELNDFYSFIFEILTGFNVPKEFLNFNQYLVSPPYVAKIEMRDGKTFVNYKPLNICLPLHEFILRQEIFSYAILSKDCIRITTVNGIIDCP